jgi:hypothetical protein
VSLAFLGRSRSILFAIVGQIKPFALWPLALTVLRDRKQLPPATLTIAAGLALGIAACGLDAYYSWWLTARNILCQGTFDPANISLPFAGLRVLHGLGVWHYSHGPLPWGPRLFLSIMGVLGPMLVIYLCRKKLPYDKLCALSLVAAAFFSPLCWNSYPTVAYILVALFIRDYSQARPKTPELVEAQPA